MLGHGEEIRPFLLYTYLYYNKRLHAQKDINMMNDIHLIRCDVNTPSYKMVVLLQAIDKSTHNS